MTLQFNHRRKYTACSLRDLIAYNESRDDSYPQFPRSPLGTPETLFWEGPTKKVKETLAFLESRSALRSSTSKVVRHFEVISRLSMIVRVKVVLNRTDVVDSD